MIMDPVALTGFLIFDKLLLMKNWILFGLMSLIVHHGLMAQQTTLEDSRTFACVNGSVTMLCNYSSGTFLWEVSGDGGSSWSTVTDNNTYSNSSTYILSIKPTDLTLNLFLYRCTVTYMGTLYAPSPADTLYVSASVPPTPVFSGSPTSVCSGSVEPVTIIGDYTGDSVYYSTSDYYPDFFGDINLTSPPIYFSGTYGSVSVYAMTVNGCGYGGSAQTTVAVNPLQSSPAGTAGAGSTCATSSVYSQYPVPTTYSDGICSPIAAVTPSGASPVSGTIQSCVTVDASVQSFNGVPYVPRYYSLEPASNASTSTATITLYFTQGDFDAYNAARGSNPALPTGPSDATGIANLRVSQFHGTGTTPATYVGGSGEIDPADNNIVWDATNSRWSVTFDVTGFSGFFVSGGSLIPLPLTLMAFTGIADAGGNVLNWTTAEEQNTAWFDVQRAVAGQSDFHDIGKVAAAGNSTQTLKYTYTDRSSDVSRQAWSYRLRMVDLDGKFAYSPIVTLQPIVAALNVRVSPNPFVQPASIIIGSPAAGAAVLSVTDIDGRSLIEKNIILQKGDNSLDPGMLARLAQGIYFLRVATAGAQQTVRIVRE